MCRIWVISRHHGWGLRAPGKSSIRVQEQDRHVPRGNAPQQTAKMRPPSLPGLNTRSAGWRVSGQDGNRQSADSRRSEEMAWAGAEDSKFATVPAYGLPSLPRHRPRLMQPNLTPQLPIISLAGQDVEVDGLTAGTGLVPRFLYARQGDPRTIQLEIDTFTLK